MDLVRNCYHKKSFKIITKSSAGNPADGEVLELCGRMVYISKKATVNHLKF